MDAMDVLGALLGNKRGDGSTGGSMLDKILRGGQPQPKPQTAPQRQPAPQRRRSPQPTQRRRPSSIGEAARSLEELLNVSTGRHQNRSSRTRTTPDPTPQPRYAPPQPAEVDTLNEQSVILIRAMIAAAKADGRIDEREQQSIVGQLGHLSQREIAFLRQEFARPSDVKELAWSVPLGMEEQVYTMSLIAIDLDENRESEYLADLAHGLRLQRRRCNEIHRQYGAPEI